PWWCFDEQNPDVSIPQPIALILSISAPRRYPQRLRMFTVPMFCFTLATLHLIPGANSLHLSQKNIIPKYPYDGTTTKYCAWWLDNDGTWTCARIEEEFELSLVDFHEWVRSI